MAKNLTNSEKWQNFVKSGRTVIHPSNKENNLHFSLGIKYSPPKKKNKVAYKIDREGSLRKD